MIQDITVYIIIAATLGYTFYSIYRIFNPKHKNSGGCAGCASSGCNVKDLKKSQIHKQFSSFDVYNLS